MTLAHLIFCSCTLRRHAAAAQRLLGLCCIAALPLAAAAQTADTTGTASSANSSSSAKSANTPSAIEPLWELGLGVGGLRLPHYRGSDQSHTLLLPVPYAIYRGKIFRATREGARAVLLDSERVDVDVSVSASAPTRSKDNLARAGMPDLAPSVAVGPNMNLRLAAGPTWRFDLRLPVLAVFTLQRHSQSLGWTVNPVLNLDLLWQGWDVGVQAGPQWATRQYNAYFYEVAPAYATATRAAYRAPSGNAGWRWTAGASRRYGNLWVGGFVRGDSVGGAAFENSPLVKQRNAFTVGLAMSWIFAVSDERVAIDD